MAADHRRRGAARRGLPRPDPARGRHARGGDVLVHLAADPGTGDLAPPAVRVSAWAVLNGLLITVARWDALDPDGWPERVRATVAFALGMLTELEDHGADLGAYHRVDLEAAAATATGGVLAGVTSGWARAAPSRPVGPHGVSGHITGLPRCHVPAAARAPARAGRAEVAAGAGRCGGRGGGGRCAR